MILFSCGNSGTQSALFALLMVMKALIRDVYAADVAPRYFSARCAITLISAVGQLLS